MNRILCSLIVFSMFLVANTADAQLLNRCCAKPACAPAPVCCKPPRKKLLCFKKRVRTCCPAPAPCCPAPAPCCATAEVMVAPVVAAPVVAVTPAPCCAPAPVSTCCKPARRVRTRRSACCPAPVETCCKPARRVRTRRSACCPAPVETCCKPKRTRRLSGLMCCN